MTTKSSRKGTSRGKRNAVTARSSSRVVFNWTDLSRGAANKDFEDLCLDLFDAEYGHGEFTLGPRRTGRDGGFDGYFTGRIENYRGRWKIACAIRQTGQGLKRKIEEERRAAVRAECTGLLVLTSADLDVPTVNILSTQAKEGLKAGRVWPRSKLELLLRKHPWVAATYFGHQLMRGFVPLAVGLDHELAEQGDLKLVGRQAECAQVRDFLSGSSRVLVVLGPGGCGKSRLLREVRAIAGRARSAWSRLPGIGTIEEGLRSGLPLGRPLVLVLDDAGRALADVHQLGHVANDRAGGRDLKVVLAARAADQEVIERTLASVPNLSRKTVVLHPPCHARSGRRSRTGRPRARGSHRQTNCASLWK